jgi:alkaline phosphatase
MAVASGDFDDGIAELRWLDDGHLATWVPLFAFGPGAPRFAGVLDNTEIGRRLAELLELDGLPPPS